MKQRSNNIGKNRRRIFFTSVASFIIDDLDLTFLYFLNRADINIIGRNIYILRTLRYIIYSVDASFNQKLAEIKGYINENP